MNEATVRFHLVPLPHPYADDPNFRREIWGEIGITADSTVLLKWQWDLAAFAAWYTANRKFLLEEELRVVQGATFERACPGESLAAALDRLQQRDFPEGQEDAQDEWLDYLYQYRQRHSLRFALRGADIPEIIIGPNRGGGEISQHEESIEWAYRFDLRDCLTALDRTLQDLPLPACR